jgi:hypothetical protein
MGASLQLQREHTMKTAYLTPVAIAAAFAALSGNALAQTAAPAAAPAAAKAPEPDYTLSGNLGIFSDYRFRGVSQTNKLPAIQGGVDLALKNGLYLGNWNSNVDSKMYNGASIEMDFYGGYKATFRRLRPGRRRHLLLLPRHRRQPRPGSAPRTASSTSVAAGVR